jgi:hypothetical protein
MLWVIHDDSASPDCRRLRVERPPQEDTTFWNLCAQIPKQQAAAGSGLNEVEGLRVGNMESADLYLAKGASLKTQ